MKKFVTILFITLLLVLIVFGLWSQTPKARNEAIVSSAHKATTERLDSLLTRADNPEENGFLNPTFVPYWGRKSTEYKEGSTAQKAVQSWGEFSTPHKGEKVDHQALQAKGDEEYQNAYNAMQEVAPELRLAMNKSLFIPPGFELNAESEIPNLISARACAQIMVGLAEAQVAQGKDEQAATDLVSVIHFGSLFRGQGTLISEMVGVAIQAIGLNGFIGLIDLNADLPAEAWKRFAGTMLESAPPEDAIVVALEGEMLFCHNSLPQLQDEPGALEEGSFLVLVPGFLSREERIYNNLMSDLVVKAKNGEDPTLPESFLNPEAADWFTGRTGVVAQILIPNSVRAGQQLQLSRKSLIAAATASGIAAYRAQEGRLPSSLDQLAQAGIPFTSDGKLIEAMEYKVDGDSATLKVRVQGPTSEIVPPSAAEWDHPWVEITNQDYLFKFHK